MIEQDVTAALQAWGAGHRDEPFALFADVRRLPGALLAARESLEAERVAAVRAMQPKPEPALVAGGDDSQQLTLF